MSDENNLESAGSLNTANVEKHSTRVSTVWFVPIFAVLIGAAMLVNHHVNQGPKIQILFKNAENLSAGKTKIKYLSIDVGKITSIALNDDDTGVIATAQLDKSVAHLLVEDSQFWVVKPRIGASGISGLDTLLSGAYLGLIPGYSDNEATTFIGADGIPPTGSEVAGCRIILRSDSNQLLSEGTSVYYRGFQAGSIEKVELDLDDNATYYHVFIKSPYNELVSTNTRFWDISGVTFESSTKGFKLHANSVESILSGSVTFGLPDGIEEGEIPEDGELYTLFRNRDDAHAREYGEGLNVVASFDSSLRGLTVGAPVEFRGLEMGHVIELNKERSVTAEDGLSHATIRLEPGRIGMDDSSLGLAELKKKVESWIGNGLNATLTTGNLLTGDKFVEFNFPTQLEGRTLDTKPKVNYIDGLLSIPTYASGLESLKHRVIGMFNRAEDLPVGDLVTDASTLVKNLDSASVKLEQLLATPATAELPANINKSLSQFEQTLAGFSPDKELYQDLEQTVFILNQSLSNLDVLLKKLKDKPNALIFNSKVKPGIAPKATKTEGN